MCFFSTKHPGAIDYCNYPAIKQMPHYNGFWQCTKLSRTKQNKSQYISTVRYSPKLLLKHFGVFMPTLHAVLRKCVLCQSVVRICTKKFKYDLPCWWDRLVIVSSNEMAYECIFQLLFLRLRKVSEKQTKNVSETKLTVFNPFKTYVNKRIYPHFLFIILIGRCDLMKWNKLPTAVFLIKWHATLLVKGSSH